MRNSFASTLQLALMLTDVSIKVRVQSLVNTMLHSHFVVRSIDRAMSAENAYGFFLGSIGCGDLSLWEWFTHGCASLSLCSIPLNLLPMNRC